MSLACEIVLKNANEVSVVRNFSWCSPVLSLPEVMAIEVQS